jgi:hypothetical protein
VGGVTTAGVALPDIPLASADGHTVSLAKFGGQPLVVVCVRYYG